MTYSRDERNAANTIVIAITAEIDFPGNALAGIDLQRQSEEHAFQLGAVTILPDPYFLDRRR
ncbi:MAG: FAD-dependent protein [Dokdonella sp.]